MKLILFSLVFVVFSISTAFGQRLGFSPQTFGGSNLDIFVTMIGTSDGGSIALGLTGSDDGNVKNFAHGGLDLFLVKFTNQHIIQWRTVLGGEGDDVATSITQLPDQSYIISGLTQSTTGDIRDKHSSDSDAWILRVEPGGTIVWSRTLGGSGRDQATAAAYINGHILVGGSTTSNDGAFTPARDSGHAWLAMLDDSGRVQWMKRYGGSGYEVITGAVSLSNDSILLAGYTSSNDGDVIGNHGGQDYWVLTVNDSGALLSQSCFGGANDDEISSIIKTQDNGAAIIGSSVKDQDDHNVFLVKLKSNGSFDWSKTYGGSNEDWGSGIIQLADKGYLLACSTNSNDGMVTNLHGDPSGNPDVWLVRVDSSGLLDWQKTYGGQGYDYAYGIAKESDTTALIAGLTESVDGDFLAQYGRFDALYFQVQLTKFGQPMDVAVEPKSDFAYYLTNSSLVLKYSLNDQADVSIDLLDIMGRERARLTPEIETSGEHIRTIDLQGLSSGTYFVRITKDGKSTIRSVQFAH